MGLFRVALNLEAVTAVTGWKIGPEIAEMNSPRADASVDGIVTTSATRSGRNPRNVAPIHAELLLGGHGEIRWLVRNDVGNAMVEVEIEDQVFGRQTTLLARGVHGHVRNTTSQLV